MNLRSFLSAAEDAIMSGQEAQARAILQKAQRAYPDSVEVYLLYTRVAQKREHAIYCLQAAKRLDPSNPETNRLWSEIQDTGWGDSPSSLVNEIVNRFADR